MAAGVLGVRKCNQEVVCDVITLSGEKITDTPAQLFAKYDVKGPIKGRIRRQRVRKNRTLRVLEPVHTPDCVANDCPEPQQGEPLATPTGTDGHDDTAYAPQELIAKELSKQKIDHLREMDELEDVIAEARRAINGAAGVARASTGSLARAGPGPSARTPGGNPPEGETSARRGRGGGGDGGDRQGSSSRFPKRGFPR